MGGHILFSIAKPVKGIVLNCLNGLQFITFTRSLAAICYIDLIKIFLELIEDYAVKKWLGDLDLNQGCAGQSREFYR